MPFVAFSILFFFPAIIAVGFGFIIADDGNSTIIQLSAAITQNAVILGIVASIFLSIMAMVIIYLFRNRTSLFLINMAIAVGALSVLTISADVTLIHYNSYPEEYLISDETRLLFKDNDEKIIKITESKIAEYDEVLIDLRSMRTSIGKASERIEVIKDEGNWNCVEPGSRSEKQIYFLDVSNNTDVICLLNIPNGERYGVENIVVTLESRKEKSQKANFTSIFGGHPPFRCGLYDVFSMEIDLRNSCINRVYWDVLTLRYRGLKKVRSNYAEV